MNMSNHESEGRKRSVSRTLNKHLGRLVLLCNILALLWLFVCCTVTWIPCDENPYLSLVTLTFPIALFVNLLFLAVWLLLNVRRVWIPILGMLLCWGYIMDYCPMNFSRTDEPQGFKVVSWNTKYMGEATGRESFEDYLKNTDADIICLQESPISGNGWSQFISQMKDKGYEYHNQKSQTLFTKLHLLQTDTLAYETRSNSSQWYLLASGDDTIMVVNNHLESNRLPAEVKQEYVDVLDNPAYEKAKESGRSILTLMAESAHYRGGQTRALRDFVTQYAGQHIIVCGDFNDTPISYACQTLERRLKSAYRESGKGIGVSFREKGFWVRIDHIFYSREGESQNTFIDRSIDVSDHYPIVSWVNFKQNQQ